MFLAPLNYDRFFRKVFSDPRISKAFLEDFLGVTIDKIELMQDKIRNFTDESVTVEFDFRCKISGNYVIIDMQQWYKPDITQRFYLYHALNSALQLENMPKISTPIKGKPGKMRKIRDYRILDPVITLIWLVDDALRFKEDYAAYAMAPECVMEFIRSKQLWRRADIVKLLQERERVLRTMDKSARHLDFLPKNRLVFMLQKNIVGNEKLAPYRRWFQFAAKTRNRKNVETDFSGFKNDEIFEEMIRRLMRSALTEEDLRYIEDEDEYWSEVRRYEAGVYIDGRKEGIEVGIEQGMLYEAREAVIDNLASRFDDVPESVLTGINAMSDVTRLKQLRKDALKADSLETFVEKL
ncbi:MAG: hypothetical protein B6244_03905 [Candidatus Cloacimonetes bacterium 4572_55]|nr:MAG: hypothetical protein B6244_03905 [Candidatus Cloacimonetes bacterium 4572_55]